MTGIGYQPLKHDVRQVFVPRKWAGAEWEYRHGYGMGLERDGVSNPVSHRASLEADEGEPDPRSAWFAGYAAGKRKRVRATDSQNPAPGRGTK